MTIDLGVPVVFVHGGLCPDLFHPLLTEPALADRRLIRYHRAGYAGSPHVGFSVGAQAAHLGSLLRHRGIDRAHVVGHSSGACIALDQPDAVRSLALLETALLAVPSGPFAAVAMRQFQAGERAAAVRTWWTGVAGEDSTLGESDADTFFGHELPAVRAWSFGPAEAARISQPVLAVLGARSHEVTPVFNQRHELLLSWLPRAESLILPHATHLLPAQNPAGLAEGLARFFTKMP